MHFTGRDKGITGIQRVARNLGRALQLFPEIELVPVRWSDSDNAIVHAEQDFCEILGMHGGPKTTAYQNAGRPLHTASDAKEFGDNWLLIPEVPHFKSKDRRFPPVQMNTLMGYAREHALRSAIIFHDLLPLVHPEVESAEDRERLTLPFIVYAQSLLNADLVFPVSSTSSQQLLGWLRDNGYRAEQLPRIIAVPLAHEISGVTRKKPPRHRRGELPNVIKFVSFGTVCRRKNQLKAFEAFNRLRLRHPNLNMEFHVVGTVDPLLAGSIARQVARAEGTIKLYGLLPDEKMLQLVNESRASVFVSLAEGFGLPIAESLWLGKPCLCSNFGAMAEIAAAGGCLTVDSTSVAGRSGGGRTGSTCDGPRSLRNAHG